MKREYLSLLLHHSQHYDQMIFLAGPRQVGKTTLAKMLANEYPESYYFNWDLIEHRTLILSGAENLAVNAAGGDFLKKNKAVIIFDELHKYKKWKQFLKGFYDLYHKRYIIVVTGSAKLNIFRRGNDSLLGRYFLYRIHPFSVGECITSDQNFLSELREPRKISSLDWGKLWEFGGFPAPFTNGEKTFFNRWKKMRQQNLFYEDIRELSHIQEISQLEVFAEIMQEQIGQLLNRSELAKKVNVSVNNINRWFNTLEHFYVYFRIKPWKKNIVRSLIKEPKIYLYDWSSVKNPGQRTENFVACHLLKTIHYWNDAGLGDYELFYVRDKEKREVDFLVTKNQLPWFLVEVKNSSNQGIGEALYRFQEQTQAPHAFQVALDAEFEEVNCFEQKQPVIVSAKTFLSQLY